MLDLQDIAESRAKQPRPREISRTPDCGVDGVDLDEQIGHLIRRAHQRASATFMAALGEYRFTPGQFFALARLKERGRLSQNHLGRLSAMDPATIQGVTKRLEERGYIERRPDPGDRRRMALSLTGAGRNVVDLLLDKVDGASRTLLAPLAPDEQKQFLRLLKRVVHAGAPVA